MNETNGNCFEPAQIIQTDFHRMWAEFAADCKQVQEFQFLKIPFCSNQRWLFKGEECFDIHVPSFFKHNPFL